MEDFLSVCLESVLRQKKVTDYEVILIDDGPSDRFGEICDRFAAGNDRIRVLHIENHGVSFARNTELDLAQGTYILYLDLDDLWEPELLMLLYLLSQVALLGKTKDLSETAKN